MCDINKKCPVPKSNGIANIDEYKDKQFCRIMLSGDVMLGRGIDSILPNPLPDVIKERNMNKSSGYRELAEKKCGCKIGKVNFDYIWGDLLKVDAIMEPDFRIINLETTVTQSYQFDPKGINYRMNPKNLKVFDSFKIDAAILSNNHALDFKLDGLKKTQQNLKHHKINYIGTGLLDECQTPLIISRNGFRVILFAAADHPNIPNWKATHSNFGIWVIDLSNPKFVSDIINKHLESINPQYTDIIILSLHWGSNWSYKIKDRDIFGKFILDNTKVQIIHGHSSHHIQQIVHYNNKVILYGCGDLLNDYEGITNPDNTKYHPNINAIYYIDKYTNSDKVDVSMVLTTINKFKINIITSTEFIKAREIVKKIINNPKVKILHYNLNFNKPFRSNLFKYIDLIPKDRKIVLLGESTHGTKEFYQIRADISKYLIKYKHFTNLFFEGNWFDFVIINDYIHSGIEIIDYNKIFDKYPNWMWNNEVFRIFIEWLRLYNKTHSNKINIYGLDLYKSLNKYEEIPTYNMKKFDTEKFYIDHLLEIKNNLKKYQDNGNSWNFQYTTYGRVHRK